MRRSDVEWQLLRDLPGPGEPSAEALNRTWEQIVARRAARGRGLLAPLAAALAVVVLVGIAAVLLRPWRSDPAPQPVAPPAYTSDPAMVRRVFDRLIAAAERTGPLTFRDGQLLYERVDRVASDAPGGPAYRKVVEQWWQPDGELAALWRREQGVDMYDPALLELRRSEEASAGPPRPAGEDNRPVLPPPEFMTEWPDDPAALRALLAENFAGGETAEQRAFAALFDTAVWEAVLPVGRRLLLLRMVSELPGVSVAEFTHAGVAMVAVRMDGVVPAQELLYYVPNGQRAGTHRVWAADRPAAMSPPARFQPHEELAVSPLAGWVAELTMVARFAAVEEIGDTP